MTHKLLDETANIKGYIKSLGWLGQKTEAFPLLHNIPKFFYVFPEAFNLFLGIIFLILLKLR